MASDNPKPSNTNLEIRKNPDYFSLYSNTLRVEVSVSDVGIIYGEIKEDSPGKYFIEDQIIVRIPLVQAKMLSNILSENIKAIEEYMGEIKIPNSFVPETYRKKFIPQIREGIKKILDS